jgi:hypothetical protein
MSPQDKNLISTALLIAACKLRDAGDYDARERTDRATGWQYVLAKAMDDLRVRSFPGDTETTHETTHEKPDKLRRVAPSCAVGARKTK